MVPSRPLNRVLTDTNLHSPSHLYQSQDNQMRKRSDIDRCAPCRAGREERPSPVLRLGCQSRVSCSEIRSTPTAPVSGRDLHSTTLLPMLGRRPQSKNLTTRKQSRKAKEFSLKLSARLLCWDMELKKQNGLQPMCLLEDAASRSSQNHAEIHSSYDKTYSTIPVLPLA